MRPCLTVASLEPGKGVLTMALVEEFLEWLRTYFDLPPIPGARLRIVAEVPGGGEIGFEATTEPLSCNSAGKSNLVLSYYFSSIIETSGYIVSELRAEIDLNQDQVPIDWQITASAANGPSGSNRIILGLPVKSVQILDPL